MPRKATQPHGTEAAYRRHLRHHETPCEDCKRAAAKRRAERRGVKKPPKAEQTMRERLADQLDAVLNILEDENGDIDYRGEYKRLYAYLNGALPAAMPREVASIVREMRSLLMDLRTLDVKGAGGDAADLEQQMQKALAAVSGQGIPDDDDLD